MKRLLDVVLAGAGALVTAPVLLGIGAAIRLESPGPALFVQTRVGRGRRPFKLAKLRTMRATDGGPQITASGDERITRLGRLLRRTKLDELPQLWSVLAGDMSIVGPRPEVPRYVDIYRPEWAPLLAVRPGLTDTASLTFRDEEALLGLAKDRERAYVDVVMPLKLQLALADVQRSSIVHDLRVIARTITAVISRPASEHPVLAEARRRIEELNRSC